MNAFCVFSEKKKKVSKESAIPGNLENIKASLQQILEASG